jgi:hypothetical protein
MQSKPRVLIHVPSLSTEEQFRLGDPHFDVRQNLQVRAATAIDY